MSMSVPCGGSDHLNGVVPITLPSTDTVAPEGREVIDILSDDFPDFDEACCFPLGFFPELLDFGGSFSATGWAATAAGAGVAGTAAAGAGVLGSTDGAADGVDEAGIGTCAIGFGDDEGVEEIVESEFCFVSFLKNEV